jgi:phenylalanyl-tRNA synthetase alpha chain
MSSPDSPASDIARAVERSLDELGVRDAAALGKLLAEIETHLQQELASLAEVSGGNGPALEAFRVRWLGRKQGILRGIGDNWLRSAPPELKREIGQRLNALRETAEAGIQPVAAAGPAVARSAEPQAALHTVRPGEMERLDVSLPGNRRPVGVRHPIRRVIDDITAIFLSLGYSVEEGPEIESVYYNFEALNIPEDHPSRDDQDTFYIDSKTVLRTHTSPVQIRTMEKRQPPIRIIVPGKVYRNETPDATHACMFHQVEGLAVDTNITFADLKGTLDHFMKAFFGSQVRTRFRPGFFPFTEPSAEVDISCLFCGTGKPGCRVCKGSGWLELGGCGMVDPAVFAYVNYDASHYSGFAFGFGVERPAMLKYGVHDIQSFVQGDVRFLHQFR